MAAIIPFNKWIKKQGKQVWTDKLLLFLKNKKDPRARKVEEEIRSQLVTRTDGKKWHIIISTEKYLGEEYNF